jgi:hypothetical protein
MSETAAKDLSAPDNAGSEAELPPGPALPGVRSAAPPSSAAGSPAPAEGEGLPARSSLPNLPGLPPPPRSSGAHDLPPRPGERFDEEQERFLIQKEDKMDYGPFSMREVRAQIEQGKVHADHNILDNETGDRRRIADHPLIGQMAREWTAKHAELERQLKDQKDRARHRDSVVKLLSGIFAALIVIGAGVGIYAKFIYKPPEKVIVKKEISNEDFFKGIQIAMKVDPPAPKKAHGPRKKGPKNGQFDDAQNMNFGEEGGDTLSPDDIQKVMNQKFGLLAGCLREEAGRNPGTKKLEFEFQVKGNGSVSSVRVNGQTGSPVASCLFAKMQAIQFPECKTCSKTHAAFSLALK